MDTASLDQRRIEPLLRYAESELLDGSLADALEHRTDLLHVGIALHNTTSKLHERTAREVRLVSNDIPPRDRSVCVSLETALLRKALERVSRLTRDGALRVTVNGAITLATSDNDLGEAEIAVPVLESNHTGADLVTGFKLAYLRDSVTTKLETIQLGLEGPTDALRIDTDDRLAVVVPMRL